MVQPPFPAIDTTLVKAHPDGRRVDRPIGISIEPSVIGEISSAEELRRVKSEPAHGLYARMGHPTTSMVARRMAELEGADDALLFASGMGAITTTLLTFFSPGGHLLVQRDSFSVTRKFLRFATEACGIEVEWFDGDDPYALARSVRHDTLLVLAESPSNPFLRVMDLKALADAVSEHNVPLLVDGTLTGPLLQRPLELGAALVMHSATKSLGGHADLSAGVVAGRQDLIDRIRATQIMVGNILDPHTAWLLFRSLRTLGVRQRHQNAIALELARHLRDHDLVVNVHYPWLDNAPDVELARRQMRGGGSVVSFELVGDLEEAFRFADSLRLIPIATSYGGVESTLELPRQPKAGEEAAPDAGLLRLSIGLEDVDDLRNDLVLGLEAVRRYLADDLARPEAR